MASGEGSEIGDLDQFRHEAGNTLGSALGRLQLLQRRVRKGQVDLSILVEELGAVEGHLHRLSVLLRELDQAPALDDVRRRPPAVAPQARGATAETHDTERTTAPVGQSNTTRSDTN